MKVLIVDDHADSREFLRTLLSSRDFEVEEAVDGKDALCKLREQLPDLVISDVLMPQMDGFTLCYEIRHDPGLCALRLIFYTGTYLEPEHERLAMALGASAFVSKPLEPDHLFQIIDQVMDPVSKSAVPGESVDDFSLLREHRDVVIEKLAGEVRVLEQEVKKRVAAEAILEENRASLRASLIGTVVAFSRAVAVRDPFSVGHQRRVSRLSREIAQQLQLTAEQVDGLRMAARIHDVGNICLPAEILNKPGELSALEYDLVKTHCQVGYEILKDVVFPWPVADVVLQHHERIDGSGYPQGLEGEAICLEARIVAVADSMVAMMSHRPYRSALPCVQALSEIREGSGSIYDSQVAIACMKVFEQDTFEFTSSAEA